MAARSGLSSPSFDSNNYDDDVVLVASDDLSVWEFVEASDDDADRFSYVEDDSDLGNGVGHDHRLDCGGEETDRALDPKGAFGSASSDVPVKDSLLDLDLLEGHRRDGGYASYGHYVDGDEEEMVEEDDENYDDDRGYDLDDDLVPWGVSDRFGKQRLKKSGKKGNMKSKMNKSKGLPCYYHNRPGVFVGKRSVGIYAY